MGEHVLVEAQFEFRIVVADTAQERQVCDADCGEGAALMYALTELSKMDGLDLEAFYVTS